jgi:hypothetical protein
MTENSKERLPHLLIKNSTTAESYSRPPRPNSAEINIPARNRQTHAQQLLEQIQEIQTHETEIIEQQKMFGLDGYKLTLSYFIKPNPDERGWVNKYRYASHGFRFDVRRPLERLSDFRQRINQKARDEEHT